MQHSILIYDKFNSIINYMLADINSMNNIQREYVIKINCESDCKVFYYSKKFFAKLFWLYRKRKWFGKIEKQDGYVVITNEAMLGLSRDDIKNLKKRGKKVIGLFIDPLNSDYKTIKHAKDVMDIFDAVYTFDPIDAKNYGLNYTNQLYSKILSNHERRELKTDLYFIGHLKDRKSFIKSLIKKGKEERIEMTIQLLEMGKNMQIDGVESLKHKISYDTILQNLSSVRCILDITQRNQAGVTLRYYEAVVYNKKLLTNNDNIVNLPFYNNEFMKIYHTIDDIDWEWVKDKKMPNYHYDNSFSPINLMKIIESEKI